MLIPTSPKRELFPHTLRALAMRVFACGVVLSILPLVVTLLSAIHPSSVLATTTPANDLNFQARLETSSGAIAPDGTYNVEFKLYNVSSGGTALWTEDYLTSAGQGVTVADGYLTVNLGSLTAFPGTINWSQQLYLTMNIGGTGGTPSWDGEMSPRLALTAVPYAFQAQSASQLQQAQASYTGQLSFATLTGGNQNFVLPDQGIAGTYNLCIQASSACGFAPGTAGSYIQNGTSLQGGANFNIDGAGQAANFIASTAIQAPSLDTATATALNIGTTNATGINLNQNTTIASGKTLTVNGSGFDASGNLGVGTTTPGANLDIQSVATTGNAINITANSLTTGSALNINTAAPSAGNVVNISENASVTTQAITSSLLNVQRSATAGPSAGSITPDSHTSFTSGGFVTSASWNHTVGADANRVLVVAINCYINNSNCAGTTTVKYAGVAMTRISSVPAPGGATGSSQVVYSLTNPAIGTNAITVTMAGSDVIQGFSESWYNVNQTTPITGITTSTTTTTSAGLTVPYVAGGVAVDFLSTCSSTATYGASQTYIGSASGSAQYIFSSYNTSNGSMSWTISSGCPHAAQTGFLLNKVSSAGAAVNGSVVSFGSNCIAAGGSCNDTSNILNLNQQYASATGTVLNIQNAGTGDMLDLVNGSGTVIARFDATGNLTAPTVNAVSGYAFNGTAGATTTCAGGQFLQNQIVQGGITTGGTCAAAGGGVTTIGTIDGGTYSANGASISGTTMYLQSASATQVGLVTLGAQTFTGAKTFSGQLTASGGLTATGTVNINTSGSAATTIGNNSSTTTVNGAFTVGAPASGRNINIGGMFYSSCGGIGCSTNITSSGGQYINLDNGNEGQITLNGWNILQGGSTDISNWNNSTASHVLSVSQVYANATVPVAVIEGGATPGAGADLLQLQNSGGKVLTKFNSNGDLQIGGANSAASTTAFQIQNAGSQSLLAADTSNMRVSVGNAATYRLGPGFAAQPTITTGNSPYASTSADLNGDGKQDIILTNVSAGTVSVLLGNGDGTFQAPQTYTVGSSPEGVAVADVNNDACPDVITSNTNSSGTISVLLNKCDGSGTLNAQTTFAAGVYPYGIAIADFNGDGKPDVAVANAGSGTTVSVLLGNGTGSFGTATTFAVGNNPWSLAVGDLNGDSKPDIVAASLQNNTISALINTSSGGTLSFAGQATYSVGSKPEWVAISDLNGDTYPDVVVANNNSSTVSVFLGSSNGVLGTQKTYIVGNSPTWVGVSDVDKDGRLDLVALNSGSNSVSVLQGKGDGTFLPQSFYGVGNYPLSAVIGEFSGDTLPDIFVANYKGNNGTLLLNTTSIQSVGSGLTVNSFAAGQAGVILQGSTGQTADYLRAQNFNGDPLLVLDSNGRLGIGTAQPTANLQVTTAIDTTSAFQIQGSGGAASVLLNADTTNMRVSVGNIGTATGQLYVSGQEPVFAGNNSDSNLNQPQNVFVQGEYAYVTNQGVTTGSGGLTIYDISNPSNPIYVSKNSDSNLNNPQGIYVQGHYAYVASYGNNKLVIYDISNPSNPIYVGKNSDNNLNGPFMVSVQGRYAFVINGGNGYIVSYDISNPANPVYLGESNGGGLKYAYSLYVQGDYAYVGGHIGSETNGVFVVFNVSSGVPTYVTRDIDSHLNYAAETLFARGRYLYVASDYGNLDIYNIANPSSPSYVGGTTDGHISGPAGLFVQGRYAYVDAYNSDKLLVYDVSDPSNPYYVGANSDSNLTGPWSLYIKGRYAYVADYGNKLDVYDLGGAYTQQLEAGGAEFGTLQVNNDTTIAGNASIKGSLSVGKSALFNSDLVVGQGLQVNGNVDASGQVLFQNTTNSTAAFQIQNAAGTNLLTTDTSNMRLNVANSSLSITSTAAPVAPTLAAGSNQGGSLSGAAATTYYYKVVAIMPGGTTAASGETSFNGASFTPLTNPTTAITGVATAGTTLGVGNYLYKYTFVTANGETQATGNESAAIATTSGNQAINLTLPACPTGATNIKIYRTAVGGASGSELYTGLNPVCGTASPYTDSVADASLSGALPAGNTATTNTNQLTVSWAAVPGASSYNVYRGTSSGGENVYFNTASTSFTDTGAAGTGGTAPTTGNGRLAVGTSTATNLVTVNALTTADPQAQVAISTGNLANQGLVIQGVASQSADLFQLQKSDGSVLSAFNANGNLSLGTDQSFGALTVANSSWITGVDSSGTGGINMFQVNGNNEIQVGAALNMDGGIVLPADSGALTLVDEPFSTGITAGTPNSYTLGIGQANALTVYGENDGSGNAQNVRVGVGNIINPQYTMDVVGDINTTGVYRIGGTQICSSSGCTVSGSSAILNQTTLQSSANFNISGTGIAAALQAGSLDTSAAGALSIGTTNATGITFGRTSSTGTITLGQSSANNTINIGSASLSGSNVQTINIGAPSGGSGYENITIGKADTASVVSVNGGYLAMTGNNGINLKVNGTGGGGALVQSVANSSSAFQVQNAASTSVFNVNTTADASNLVTNGDFEQNVNGWAAMGAATLSQYTGSGFTGSKGLSIATTAAAGDGAKYAVSLTANTTYTFSFYVSDSTTDISNTSLAFGYNDNGTDTDCNAGWGSETGVWSMVNCTFTTGATVSGSPYIYIGQTDAVARSIYVDAVQLNTKGSSWINPYRTSALTLNGVIASPVAIQPTVNSNTAFSVYDGVGNTLFNIDANTRRVTLSTSNSATPVRFLVGNGSNDAAIGTLNVGTGDQLKLQNSTGTVFDVQSAGATTITTTTNSGNAFQIQNSNGASGVLLNADTTNMRVSIGSIGTPTGQLYVGGTLPTYVGQNSDSNLSGPMSVSVQGRYAYVISQYNNKLVTYDISSGTPVYVGQNSDSNLSGPMSVSVQGRYAYVVGGSNVVTYDISSGTPVYVGQNSDSNLSSPTAITVQGRYAYVVSNGTNKLVTYDISSGTPVYVGQNSDSNLSGPMSVSVQGRYAYVVGGSNVVTYDISSGTPVYVGQNSDSNANYSYALAVSGNYAYVADHGSGSCMGELVTYDISSGTPVYVGQNSDGNLCDPQSLSVSGRYAYVVNWNNALLVYDISSGTPVYVGQNSDSNISGPRAVAVSGRYAYVASSSNSKLIAYDLGGAYLQQAQTGSLETGDLQVDGRAQFAADASIQGGLNIGRSLQVTGDVGMSGQVLLQSSANSATAFRVQNSSGTNLILADTSAMVISSAGTLSIQGSGTSTFSGTLAVGSGGDTVTLSAAGGIVAAGTARHTKSIVLAPEYANAVLDASGDSACATSSTGTLTAGLAAGLTGFGNTTQNYYKWVTTGTTQCYDVVVQVPIPTDFSAWASTTPLAINGYTTNTTSGTILVQVLDTTGAAESNYTSYASVTPGAASTWTAVTAPSFSGTYTAGGTMTVKVRLTSSSTVTAVELGNISLNYLSKF